MMVEKIDSTAALVSAVSRIAKECYFTIADVSVVPINVMSFI